MYIETERERIRCAKLGAMALNLLLYYLISRTNL